MPELDLVYRSPESIYRSLLMGFLGVSAVVYSISSGAIEAIILIIFSLGFGVLTFRSLSSKVTLSINGIVDSSLFHAKRFTWLEICSAEIQSSSGILSGKSVWLQLQGCRSVELKASKSYSLVPSIRHIQMTEEFVQKINSVLSLMDADMAAPSKPFTGS